MKKEEKKPDTQVAARGLIGSTLLLLLLIHFWIADLAAMVLGLSREVAYLSSVMLLVVLNGWRYRLIQTRKDPVTFLVNKFFK